MENTNYYKLAILIVLYGKEVEQCETFTNIDRILKIMEHQRIILFYAFGTMVQEKLNSIYLQITIP